MKKITLATLLILFALSSVIAQQEKGIIGYNNWLNPWTEFKPNQIDYGKPTQIISGNITKDTRLRKREIYLLVGDVFVTDSTTLTIEPGTVIIGDFDTKASLVISNGSTLYAQGTNTDPIVFTSSKKVKKPGDWGGIFVLGNAPTNHFGNMSTLEYGLKPDSNEDISYGGKNPDSFSGVISHVRIEYAGKRTKKYGYYNGLTLAGVGKETIVENIMVSYCKGNSFSILGGNLLLDKMVSYKSHINDYKFNYGAQCEIINSLAIKSPYISGSGRSRCLVVSNHDDVEDTDFSNNQTLVESENLTLINLSNDLDYDIKVGLVNEAIYVGEEAAFSTDKSVISGFNPAVMLDNNIKLNNNSLENIRFTRSYFNNCNGNIFKEGIANNDDLENWYGNRAYNNVYSKGQDSETFINSNDDRRPDFRLKINGIIASTDDDD